MEGCKRCLILVLIILNSTHSFSQKFTDSLSNKNFNQLLEIFQESSNFELRKKVTEKIIQNAKQKKTRGELVVGYYLSSELYNNTKLLSYCDSIISITSNNSMKSFPSMAYLSKGSFYQEKGDYINAIENYLSAKKYATFHENENLILTINFSIGTLKRKIGEYDSALELYKSNIPFAKKNINEYNSSTHYLNTLISISNVYYELKELDSARHYNKLGVLESKKLKNEDSFHHFSANEGIVNFFDGKYKIATDSLEKHGKYFASKNDSENLYYIYYYLGRAHEALGRKVKSLTYYKKVDSIFQLEPYSLGVVRSSYTRLVKHYKSENDLKNQLYFINKLMSFDSLANENQFYLNKTIFKEYDIPKLELEKKNILVKLKNKENRFLKTILSLSVFLVLIILFSIYQFTKRKIYKKRFEKIINKSRKVKNSNLPKKLVDKILNGLEQFERKKNYLSNKTTLNTLATQLHTNSNYLSKIINQFKKESFSNYINKLRIEYIIEELKINSTYRKYTIKAISDLTGFNNAESFSKAFYKFTGLKPSYFIKELEKKINRYS